MDGNEETANPRAGRQFLGLLAAGVLIVIAGLAVLRYFADGMPKIGPADLEDARRRWDSAAIPDYRLTILMSGRQTGELKVEVRGGRPVGMTRNGNPVESPEAWDHWTVPGMFGTLDVDFDNAAHNDVKFEGAEVVMRAEFDSQYGFPRRYLHQVIGRYGDLEWKVTEFTPL
jgi:hypothetical protein